MAIITNVRVLAPTNHLRKKRASIISLSRNRMAEQGEIILQKKTTLIYKSDIFDNIAVTYVTACITRKKEREREFTSYRTLYFMRSIKNKSNVIKRDVIKNTRYKKKRGK